MRKTQVTLSDIPAAESEIFLNSTFFEHHSKLPTPADVRAQAALQNSEDFFDAWHPPPARFPDLNLIVKYGGSITIAEGQCMWMIRKYVGNIIPVPEVYGWCCDDGQTFLYMELISGTTLEQRWDGLFAEEKISVCAQLRSMIEALRTLRRDADQTWISSICGGELQDIWFEGISNVGPFPDAAAFHNFFSQYRWEIGPSAEADKIEEGSLLPSDSPISFVHGDLHRSNIILNSAHDDDPVCIKAIIDWHQAGWMPMYWEFFKMRWTVFPEDEWRTKYIEQIIMPPPPELLNALDYISSCHPT
jgi:hypothetical protein